MNTEINKTQFIERVVERYNDTYDGENHNAFLDDVWNDICELYNVYDGQFSELDEYEMMREINKRVGIDMKWYDFFNKPPKKEELEQRELTDKEKFRLERDQIMDRYKGGDFE